MSDKTYEFETLNPEDLFPGEVIRPLGPWLPEHAVAYADSGACGVRMTASSAPPDEEFSFLAELPGLRYLEIYDQPRLRPGTIERLDELEFLGVFGTPVKGELDVGHLALRGVFAHAGQKYRGLLASEALEYINLDGYKDADLTPLQHCAVLRELHITGRDLRSLDGLPVPSCLRLLMLRKCPKLENLEGIDRATELRELRVSGSPNVGDVSVLRHLSGLRILELENCGEIPTIAWLEELTQLQLLVLLGSTKVLDESVGSLMRMPSLERAVFRKWRHYSVSPQEVADQIASRA